MKVNLLKLCKITKAVGLISLNHSRGDWMLYGGGRFFCCVFFFFLEVVVLMLTEHWLYVMKRLPVPGTASPNQHCRCKHAVCPQSRRRTAAGPCCRQSCSCRSPQLLGVQGNPSQPLCQGHEHAVSHVPAEILMVCIHHSWHSGKPNIYIS